jgi:hypothetical protein
MARLIPNGNTKIVWLDTAAYGVPATISAADIAAATDLTPFIMSLAASVSAQALPVPSMDSLFEAQIGGVEQGQLQLDLYREDSTEGGNDEAWEVLTRGESGCVIVSRLSSTISDGDYVEVWPSLVLSRAMANMTSNGILTFTVQCALTGTPNESFQVTATAVPSAPINVIATAGVTGTAVIDWDAPSQGAPITGYKVFKSATASGTYTEITTNIVKVGTTASLSSQTAGVSFYKVKATNATGDSSFSSASNSITIL